MPLIATKDLYVLTVIALLRVSGGLPSALKDPLVRGVARAAFLLSGDKRRHAEQALAAAFPALDDRARRAIMKGSFYTFWSDMFSLLPSAAERDALARASLHGLEHLRRAMANGRGAILWVSNHFGRLTAAKQLLHGAGFPAYKVHVEDHLGGFGAPGDRPTRVKERVIRPFFDRHERRFVAGIVYVSDSASLAFTRVLLECLRQNAVLCVSADARSGRRYIALPLLGLTDVFPTGVVSLARLSAAPILPMFCVRAGPDDLRLVIEAPIPVGSCGDRERSAEHVLRHYLSLLEAWVRQFPSQYIAWHLLGLHRHSIDPARIVDGRSAESAVAAAKPEPRANRVSPVSPAGQEGELP